MGPAHALSVGSGGKDSSFPHPAGPHELSPRELGVVKRQRFDNPWLEHVDVCKDV